MFMHYLMHRAYIICIIICILNFVLSQISCTGMLIYFVKIIDIKFLLFLMLLLLHIRLGLGPMSLVDA